MIRRLRSLPNETIINEWNEWTSEDAKRKKNQNHNNNSTLLHSNFLILFNHFCELNKRNRCFSFGISLRKCWILVAWADNKYTQQIICQTEYDFKIILYFVCRNFVWSMYSIKNSKKVTVWTVFKYLFFTFSTCTIKQCNHKSSTIALIELLDLRRIQNNECHNFHPKPKLMQKNEFFWKNFHY